MTGKGHNWAGVALIPAVYYETFSTFNSHIVSMIASLALLSGSTAPDWLEIRKKKGGTIITHRTITHWLPLWILMLFGANFLMVNETFELMGAVYNSNKYFAACILGFSVGGLLHLAVDFPNPMGVPVFTPKHRISLNLWKSGKKEGLIISMIVLFSFFYVGIQSGVVDINTAKIIELVKSVS